MHSWHGFHCGKNQEAVGDDFAQMHKHDLDKKQARGSTESKSKMGKAGLDPFALAALLRLSMPFVPKAPARIPSDWSHRPACLTDK